MRLKRQHFAEDRHIAGSWRSSAPDRHQNHQQERPMTETNPSNTAAKTECEGSK
jgi:hypothetical protein